MNIEAKNAETIRGDVPPMQTVADMIEHLKPCKEALAWARGYTSPAKAWRECENPAWMLWIIGRTMPDDRESKERRTLVLCACEIARLSLPHVTPGELRPLKAIETAESWARGEGGTLDDVRAAAEAAAETAAWAAGAAEAAAWAAGAAGAAAWAAGAAGAAEAAAEAAGAATTKQACDIIRKHYPKPPRFTRQAKKDTV